MSPGTTHSDKVVGWIVLSLAGAVALGMCLASYAPHLDPAARGLILGIASSSAGALGATLTIRRPPAQDSTQQVTIPSSDPSTPPTTIVNTTGLASQQASPSESKPGT